jgi:carboxyl-terminal processing protease
VDKLALASLEDVFLLIEKYYIEKVDVSILAKGAIQGMTELIRSKQLLYVYPAVDYQMIKTPSDATELLRKAVFEFHIHTNIDYVQLADSSIRGMLSVLNYEADYWTKEEYMEKVEFYNGTTASAGIDLKSKGREFINISPLEDTPAYKAGIRPGDTIIKIDGLTIAGMSPRRVLSYLRGQNGTSVTLTIRREGWQEPRDYKVLMEQINQNNVEDRLIDTKIGYIRIKRFSRDTEDNLAYALHRLEKSGITCLILDLRNNPGGVFANMMKVADQFLGRSNALFVYLEDRNQERKEFHVNQERLSYGFPMIVIVNKWTGGASEILAQGLKEWDRALIIGERSAGALIARSVIPLRDGAALTLPTGEYFSPKGVSFSKGVTPDTVLEEDMNNPIDFAVDLFREIGNEASSYRLRQAANILLAEKTRHHTSTKNPQ